MTRLVPMEGKKFGLLTVVSRGENTASEKARYWCRCSCGKENLVLKDGYTLRKSKNPSCGCEKAKLTSLLRRKDGFFKHPLAGLHKAIMRRCHSPNDVNYHKYGARGIFVCDHWHSRANFCTEASIEMGPRPSMHHSIDRIDTRAGYRPGNVRWATFREQARNSLKSKLNQNDVGAILAMYSTGRFSCADIAEQFGINGKTAWQIVKKQIWPDIEFRVVVADSERLRLVHGERF